MYAFESIFLFSICAKKKYGQDLKMVFLEVTVFYYQEV